MAERIVGALGAVGPTALIVALFVVSGTFATGAAGSLVAVGVLAAIDGAIVGPLVLRPRRRALRGALAYALVAAVLWIGLGMAATVIGMLTGPDTVSDPVMLLLGRLAYAFIYGLLFLVPLAPLGGVWVGTTWVIDRVRGGS